MDLQDIAPLTWPLRAPFDISNIFPFFPNPDMARALVRHSWLLAFWMSILFIEGAWMHGAIQTRGAVSSPEDGMSNNDTAVLA